MAHVRGRGHPDGVHDRLVQVEREEVPIVLARRPQGGVVRFQPEDGAVVGDPDQERPPSLLFRKAASVFKEDVCRGLKTFPVSSPPEPSVARVLKVDLYSAYGRDTGSPLLLVQQIPSSASQDPLT